jgi:hypothetical protein
MEREEQVEQRRLLRTVDEAVLETPGLREYAHRRHLGGPAAAVIDSVNPAGGASGNRRMGGRASRCFLRGDRWPLAGLVEGP